MIMEHRWGVRRNVHLDAVIHSRNQGAQSARVRNISSSGLYADTVSRLELNQPVTVEFGQPESPLVYLLSAYVVRTTPEGAGLMFNEPDTKELSLLLDRLPGGQADATGRPVKTDLQRQRDGSGGVN